jgi:cation diffusion facilitator CzcD-associated flavoprotein CzcO
VPTAAAAEKLGRWWLKRCVPDPELRDKLTPRYSLGCKRPAFHNSYLQTYNRPNVTLETTGIERITETGVRMTDGTEHEVDVLITATGFQVFATGSMPPFPVAGADGRDLDAHWQEHRFRSYQGVAVPGFPNFHLVFGPYGYNLSSYFTLVETQVRHIGRVLGEARRRRATRVEVKREAEERYMAEQLRRRKQQLLVRANCSQANSYYFDRAGDSPFRVGPTPEMHWRSRRFPLDDYRFSGVAGGARAAAPVGTAASSPG